MLALFLGAGFSKWAADLPLTSQLFDFEIEPWGPREYKKLEIVKSLKHNWDLFVICDFLLEGLWHNNLALERQILLHGEVAFKHLMMPYLFLAYLLPVGICAPYPGEVVLSRKFMRLPASGRRNGFYAARFIFLDRGDIEVFAYSCARTAKDSGALKCLSAY